MRKISKSQFLKKRYTACLKENGEKRVIASGNRIELILQRGKEVLFPAVVNWAADPLLRKAYPTPSVVIYQGNTAYDFIRMRVNLKYGVVVWKRIPPPSEQKKKPGPPAKEDQLDQSGEKE